MVTQIHKSDLHGYQKKNGYQFIHFLKIFESSRNGYTKQIEQNSEKGLLSLYNPNTQIK